MPVIFGGEVTLSQCLLVNFDKDEVIKVWRDVGWGQAGGVPLRIGTPLRRGLFQALTAFINRSRITTGSMVITGILALPLSHLDTMMVICPESSASERACPVS